MTKLLLYLPQITEYSSSQSQKVVNICMLPSEDSLTDYQRLQQSYWLWLLFRENVYLHPYSIRIRQQSSQLRPSLSLSEVLVDIVEGQLPTLTFNHLQRGRIRGTTWEGVSIITEY